MQDVLTLTPGGLPLARSLGFTAASVICDNYTSSYLTLTDAGKTIPPWTYGAVVALPPGTNRASATLTATVPAIPGPPVPVIQASLTWTDAALPADPGHLLQQVTTQQQNVLGTVTAAANTSATETFDVPAGTLAIGFAANHDAASVSFTGVQTGVEYFIAAAAQVTDGVQTAALDGKDTQVTVKLDQTGQALGEIDVLAWPVLPVTTIKQNAGALPLGVILEDASSAALALDQAVSPFSLGVSMFQATPAPWQAPTAFARFAGSIAANGTSTLVSAVTGKVVRVFGPVLSSDGGAGGATDVIALEDTSGTIIQDFRNVSTLQTGSPGPLPQVLGRGVRLHNFSAAALTIRCTFGYSQA